MRVREREREKMKAVRMNDTISRCTPWDALCSYYPWMEAFSLGGKSIVVIFQPRRSRGHG